MKLEIFAVNLNSPIDPHIFNFFMQHISLQKRERIFKHEQKKGKDLMVLGEILARFGINKLFKIPFSEIAFETTHNKKPYILFYENIYFNISHSGDWVVCAVSDVDVGIDIQKITDIDYAKISSRFFPNNDIKTKLSFFSLWTKKESYLKMLGKGIPHGLDCEFINCKFYEINDIDGYLLNVCTRHE